MQCSSGITDQRRSLLESDALGGIAATSARMVDSSSGHNALRYSAVEAIVDSKTVARVRSRGRRGPVTAARMPRP